MAKKIYIERLIDKNVGPISDLEINFSFIDNGDPKPVVFVGENGTGKTALISNIADAFYEMAGKAFSNAIYPNGTNGYQYFTILKHMAQYFFAQEKSFVNNSQVSCRVIGGVE